MAVSSKICKTIATIFDYRHSKTFVHGHDEFERTREGLISGESAERTFSNNRHKDNILKQIE